jgi:hypothetical protein
MRPLTLIHTRGALVSIALPNYKEVLLKKRKVVWKNYVILKNYIKKINHIYSTFKGIVLRKFAMLLLILLES